MLSSIKSLLVKSSKKDIFAIVICGLLLGCFEGIGIFTFMPAVEGLFSNHNDFSNFIFKLILFSAVLLTHTFLTYGLSVYLSRAELGIVNLYQKKIFSSLANGSLEYLYTKRKSDLIEVLIKETRRIGQLLLHAVMLLNASFSLLVLTILSLDISLLKTIGIFAFGAFLLLVFRLVSKTSFDLGSKLHSEYQKLLASATEQLAGVLYLRSLGDNVYYKNSFDDASDNIRKVEHAFTVHKAKSLLFSKLSFFVFLAALAISMVGIKTDKLEMVTLFLIFTRLAPKFSTISQGYQSILNILPSLELVEEIIKESENSSNTILKDVCVEIKGFRSIKFNRISYQYPDSNILTLQNCSFEIPSKGISLMIGPSGSGKSTLLKILLGILKPQSGSLYVDNNRVDENYVSAFRKIISFVPQEPFFIHGTIRENVLLGCEVKSDQEIYQVLETVKLKNLILKLENGLDSIIGDLGVKLSGGERQRLSLARALLRNPKLIILDEATNALDLENENIIQDILNNISINISVLMVAHRVPDNCFYQNKFQIVNGEISKVDAIKFAHNFA